MGAVCDWSIPSSSKPFFSLRHVQSVDKRHHPTDSLIKCEMYSYLPLSYSRAPKTPPLPASSASPLLPVCKGKKQTGLHKDSFWKKKRKLLSLQISCFKIFHSVPIISNMHTALCTHAFTHRDKREHTRSVFKHRNARTRGQRECSQLVWPLKLCSWALCSTHADTCPMHFCLSSLNCDHAEREPYPSGFTSNLKTPFSPIKALYPTSFQAVPSLHSCPGNICHKIPDTFLNCAVCCAHIHSLKLCKNCWCAVFFFFFTPNADPLQGGWNEEREGLNFDQFICIFYMSKPLIYLPVLIAFMGSWLYNHSQCVINFSEK